MTRRMATLATVLVLLCAVFIPVMAVAQTDPPPPPPPTSTLIVKVAAGLTAAEQADVIARNGGVEISTIPALRLHIVQVNTDQLAAALASYQADPQVVRAEENKTRRSETIPSDPLYPNQWALPQIAWDQVFGTVVPTGTATVAVLDTGIDATHPDLAGNVIPGTSILDGSTGLTDPSGHGTWVAGIIAARTDPLSTEGIAGVGYAGVRVMPVTVLNAQGLGQDSDVIAGVLWAADHGADVILMAFSNPGFSESLQEAIDYAWSLGVVLVAAVGNDALITPTFPAGDRGVIGVSATDPGDQIAAFSNDGQAVFLAAPGTDIATTSLGGAYATVTGTSTSAAIVAGVAAFMKAMDPSLTNGIIVGRMARTADPAGSQDQTGNGRINMARALADTSTDPVQPAGAAPVGNGGPFVGPYVAAAKNLTLTFAGTGGGTISFSNFNPTPNAASCTATCIRSVDNNQTGTMTVTPNAGSVFTGWSSQTTGLTTANGGGTQCTTTNSPCNFFMGTGGGSAQSGTATFTSLVTKFKVEAAAGGNIPTQTAGTPFSIKITAQNAADATITSFTGQATISSTGTLSSGSGLTANFVSGVLTSHSVTISNAGSFTITATGVAPNTGAVGTSNSFTVTGAVNAGTSTVSASPGSVTADGTTTSTITVTLKDASSNPVSGKTVTLAQGTGTSTISAASGVSSALGVVTFTVKATVAQVVTYTATDTTDSVTITQTAAVTFTAGAVNAAHSTVGANPASVAADNTTTSTITVTLKDVNDNPVSGKTVTLAQGTGTSTISAASGVSSALGVVTFTVKATVAQVVTYTATDATDSVTITQTATVTFTAVGNAGTSTVSASPGSVTADGTTTSTITVTLKDASSNPVSGKTVTLAQGTGTSTISAASGPSSALGVVTFTVKATAAQAVTYTATDTTDSVTITQTATVTFTAGAGNAGTSTVSASPGSVTADGTTTSTITVTLKDVNNNPVSGKTVTLAQGTGTSTISAASGPSSALGVVTFTVKATVAQVVTYTATDTTDSVTITQTAAVTFTAGALDHFKVEAAVVGNIGTQTAGIAFNIKITAQDVNNNTATSFNGGGNKVNLTSTGTLIVTGGNPTVAFTFGVLSSQGVTITNTGNFTITAKEIGAGGAAKEGTSNSFLVTAGAVSAANSTIAGTSPVAANGVATSTVTITLLDGNAIPNPVSGVTPTFSATGSNNVYGACSATNASGVSMCALSSTTAEVKTLSILTPVVKLGVTGVTFTAGTPVAGGSTTITGSGPVVADGVAFSTVTITLADAFNNPVPGVTPTFSATGSNNVYGACSATNASGQSTCALRSTTAEIKTLSIATPVVQSGGTVTFTAGAPAAVVYVSPDTSDLQSGSTRTFTAKIVDANGNTVTGYVGSITFDYQTGPGTVTGLPSVVAVGGGMATSGTLTAVLAGNVTVRASSLALATADTSFTVTAGEAAAVLYVTPDTSDLQSGSTRTFTAKIVDAVGNTVTGYAGSITFDYQAGPGTVTGLPSVVVVGGGMATSGNITGVVIGNVTVRASSAALATADTSFMVTPGTLHHFAISNISSPQAPGIAFGISITAQDASNNTVTGFGGTVDLSANAGTTTPTVSGTFATGLRNENVAVSQAGLNRTITVTRTGGSETGTSNTFSVDTAPTDAADWYVMLKDETLVVGAPGVLANDNDADGGQTLTVAIPILVDTITGSGGTLHYLNANGSFSYTPLPGFTGIDSFQYQATDGILSGSTVTVTITVVDPAVTKLVALNDAYTTNLDSPLTVLAPGVLGNDDGVLGTTTTITVVGSPAHGTLAPSNDGSFLYTPTAGFTGTDSFAYTVTNINGTSNVAMVTIGVGPAKIADNDAYTTDENSPLTVLAASGVLTNDAAGASRAAALVSGPTFGTLGLAASGGFTYTPDTDFGGVDSFIYRTDYGAGVFSNLAMATIIVRTTTVLAVDPATGVYGGEVPTLSATLTANGSPLADMTVNFTLNGTPVGSGTTDTLGVATVSNVSLSGINAGPYPNGVGASFAGDTYFVQSSGTAQLTVEKRPTSTAVTTSGTPSIYGDSVTFTATVTGSPSAPNPSSDGEVTFKADGSPIATCSNVAVNASGVATCSTSALAVAGSPHAITAEYRNGTNFANSDGTLAGGQTVNRRPTNTAVTSSLNPSIFGQSVTFTATVTGSPSPPNPNTDGDVTFKADGVAITGCSNKAVNASGVATCSTAALTASISAHAITAEYRNGANFANSDGTLAGGQTVNKRDTSTAVASSLNPSIFGQSVTFTATVTGPLPAPGVNPISDGNVTFKADGGTIATCGNVAVNASGVATCSTSALTVPGSAHAITAEYRNGANFNNSDGTLTNGQTVNKRNTYTALTTSGTPSIFGQSVTFTATVTGPSPAPGVNPSSDGDVTFKADGSPICANVAVNASGVATCSYNALTVVGSPHTITADYANANNFNNSSRTLTGGQSVSTASTTSSVSVAPNPRQYSDLVTFTATLSPDQILGFAPATSVTFYVGTQNMGTAPLVAGGGVLTATLSNVALLETVVGQMAPGSHPVTGSFNGVNPNFTVTNPTTALTPLTINQENALVAYSGLYFFWTASTSTNSVTVPLSATIQDISDGNPGDIRKATVTFVDGITRSPLNAACTNVPVTLINPADTTTGRATCNFTETVDNTGSTQYTIGIIVGGYYTRDDMTDNTVVTVALPLANFITGGGYLVLSQSAGLVPSTPGSKANFGYNVKYTKSLSNLQGHVNIIFRNTVTGRTYQIKSTSLTSLGVANVTPTGGQGQFLSKANLTDITNPLAVLGIANGGTLQMSMTDKGEPGSTDTLAITFWDKDNQLMFSSQWSGVPPTTHEQLLGGGNLAVH